MRRSTLIYLFSISAIVILLLVIATSNTNSTIRNGLEERESKNMLDELIAATNGQHEAINADLKGKTVVINVWATWCGPCVFEIPKLNEMVEEFDSEDIVFIALDEQDSTKEVEIMADRNIEFDYELFFGQKPIIDQLYSYKLETESRAVPLNIVLNKEGKAEFYYMGNIPAKLEELREYLASVK